MESLWFSTCFYPEHHLNDRIWLHFKKYICDSIFSMLQSTALIRTLKLSQQKEALSFLTCICWWLGAARGQAVLGKGSGDICQGAGQQDRRDVPGCGREGRGEVLVSSGSVSPCFCRVFQLFPPTCWWAGWFQGMENSL